MTTVPAIAARDLGKSYGTTWAVRSVTLDVARAEAVAVFGPNGAGKSTLLRLLATLTPLSRGSLRICGAPAERPSRGLRQMLGVLTQETYLYPELSAAENLRLYSRLYVLPDETARVREALDALGLSTVAQRPVRELSRGMQQRLALARATLHRPAVLLLDEPEHGLDGAGQARLAQLLAAGRARGQVVLLATHHLELGLRLCERALILAGGRLVCDAPAAAYTGAEWHARYERANNL